MLPAMPSNARKAKILAIPTTFWPRFVSFMITFLVATASGAMGLTMTNGPTIVEAVVVRHIGVSLATLATLTGLVSNVYSGHRCHFLSVYLIEVYHRGLTLAPMGAVRWVMPIEAARAEGIERIRYRSLVVGNR